MNRTNRGSKGPGYEYWGRRKPSGYGYGKPLKKQTHKSERQQGKDEIRKLGG